MLLVDLQFLGRFRGKTISVEWFPEKEMISSQLLINQRVQPLAEVPVKGEVEAQPRSSDPGPESGVGLEAWPILISDGGSSGDLCEGEKMKERSSSRLGSNCPLIQC